MASREKKKREPIPPVLGNHRYRFNKPFYRRAWFWVWTVVLLADAGLITLSVFSGWFFPCVTNKTGYGNGYATTCSTEQGGRIVSAIGNGFQAFCCLLCINVVILIIWGYWTFFKKPEIQLRQIKADEDMVKGFNPDGTFRDELPDTTDD